MSELDREKAWEIVANVSAMDNPDAPEFDRKLARLRYETYGADLVRMAYALVKMPEAEVLLRGSTFRG